MKKFLFSTYFIYRSISATTGFGARYPVFRCGSTGGGHATDFSGVEIFPGFLTDFSWVGSGTFSTTFSGLISGFSASNPTRAAIRDRRRFVPASDRRP